MILGKIWENPPCLRFFSVKLAWLTEMKNENKTFWAEEGTTLRNPRILCGRRFLLSGWSRTCSAFVEEVGEDGLPGEQVTRRVSILKLSTLTEEKLWHAMICEHLTKRDANITRMWLKLSVTTGLWEREHELEYQQVSDLAPKAGNEPLYNAHNAAAAIQQTKLVPQNLRTFLYINTLQEIRKLMLVCCRCSSHQSRVDSLLSPAASLRCRGCGTSVLLYW